MARSKEPIVPSDWVVLALVAESPTHGWAISTQLSRDAEIGSIWSLGRPIVYQGLDRLGAAGLIRTVRIERGARGPHRVIYDVTPAGRRALRDWLARPIEHVREIRSFFLLKVVLSQRAGLDLEPLLLAQKAAIAPFASQLEDQLERGEPAAPGDQTALRFRLETVRSIVRFIDGTLDRQKNLPGGVD